MVFNSVEFLIFFPAVSLIYFILPHKVRYIFLLIASYYFYMCWNPKYALLMFFSTVVTYLSGIFISGCNEKYEGKKLISRKRLFVALSFTINLLILFSFKYFGMAADLLTHAFSLVGVEVVLPSLDVVLPVGISFYTFQALSYTADVYRNEISAEKNFLKYALFVSFFPQLVAGPIERSKNLLGQVSERHYFDAARVRDGLLQMMFGYFQKVVLSSYLAIIVDSVYLNWTQASGFQLFIATFAFAFQIYCDFGGYSNIAIGAAKVMGFRLMENFNVPYMSRSVGEFWHRWHISLSTWFRDYLYIPLGGNRRGRARKYLNVLITFVVSGLWHGASMHFVVWGFLNGLFQVIEDLLKPLFGKINSKTHINTASFSHRVFKTALTFILVNLTWVFFRAESFSDGVRILARIFGLRGGYWFTWGTNLQFMGITMQVLNLIVVSLAILIAVDIMKYQGIKIIDLITRQKLWLRWIIVFAALFGILIFGAYGPGYNSAEFIYFQF